MKQQSKLTAEDKAKAPKRGSSKVARIAKRKAHYAGNDAKVKYNAKAKIRRHIRNYPECLSSRTLYALRYGEGALAAVVASIPTSALMKAEARMRERAKVHTAKRVAQARIAAHIDNPLTHPSPPAYVPLAARDG